MADTDHDIAVTLLLSGRLDDARQHLASVHDGPRRDQLQALLAAPAAASAALARLQADRSALGLFLQAEVAAHRGDIDLAFDQLGAALRAYEDAQVRFTFDLPHAITLSPFLRALQGDPRWAVLHGALAPPWA
jgi:hypothetical protein